MNEREARSDATKSSIAATGRATRYKETISVITHLPEVGERLSIHTLYRGVEGSKIYLKPIGQVSLSKGSSSALRCLLVIMQKNLQIIFMIYIYKLSAKGIEVQTQSNSRK